MTIVAGCVKVKAMLGGPKGKEAVALSDDETIEKCLNEVEAALNAGLNFKGKFNSGLQVRSSSSPSLGKFNPGLQVRSSPSPSLLVCRHIALLG